MCPEEEINLMKENAIPRNTKYATKFEMTVIMKIVLNVTKKQFNLRAECGVRSAECGVRSAECGVRSAECGERSFKKNFKKFKKTEIKQFKSELKE